MLLICPKLDVRTGRHIKLGGRQLNKHKLKALILMVGAIFMAFLMVNLNSQASTSRDQGVDWSKFQSWPAIGGAVIAYTIRIRLG